MTLIIAAIGRQSIWLSADRRLTAAGKIVRDDAVKILDLERSDGRALLGYSGLGQTPRGQTQPSDWMNATVRGVNVPLEQALLVIASAVCKEVPKYLRHVAELGNSAHVILAPAFVDGKPALYSIELDLDRITRKSRVRVHRNEADDGRPTRIALAGSGGGLLIRQRARLIALLRLIRKHELGKISAQTVAQEFAKLNKSVAGNEITVGPDCIVAWRYRTDGPLKGGGASASFKGMSTGKGFDLPTNANGIDVKGVIRAILPVHMKHVTNRLAGKNEPLDYEAVHESLKNLPDGPDDNLK